MITHLEKCAISTLVWLLALVLSPTLAIMGAQKRWGTFRQGTELRAKNLRKEDVLFAECVRTFATRDVDARAWLHRVDVELQRALALNTSALSLQRLVLVFAHRGVHLHTQIFMVSDHSVTLGTFCHHSNL